MPTAQDNFKSRSRQFTSATALTAFSPPINWVSVRAAGTVTMKDEAGAPVAFTNCAAGDIIPGPFSEFTSTTCARIWLGDGPLPPAPASAALSELYTNLLTSQAMIPVDLAGAILAAGTPMAAFADNAGASAPGITLVDSKAKGLRWNNFATQTAVWLSASMPQDIDITAPLVLHALLSKSGATTGDATTLTVTAFFQTVAALHDADTDCGGTSSAIVGAATAKTVTEVTLSILAADLGSLPCALSFSIKPTNATNGTDDVIVEALWFEYTRKALTS